MTRPPPLLVLADGGKPQLRRKPRAPTPRESILHATVAYVLRSHCLPDWRWCHISLKAKDAREGAIMKKLGVQSGWFDFILISPTGQPHFLETKRLGMDLSEAQQEFQSWCVHCGIPNAVVWTIAQALAAFDAWGCLRIRVGAPNDNKSSLVITSRSAEEA